jgi:hypothetical protein
MMNSHIGHCSGTSRKSRIRAFEQQVLSIPPRIPVAFICTCVMQNRLMNTSRIYSRGNTFQLAQAPRRYPLSAADTGVIVVPYFSGTAEHVTCASRRDVFWAGSLSVDNRKASHARRHLDSIANRPGNHSGRLHVKPSQRRCSGSHDALGRACINGHSQSHQHKERKMAMRKAMRAAGYCMVLEGDSPASSRMFDAITELCVPVIVSSRIAVPRSDAWGEATIQITHD